MSDATAWAAAWDRRITADLGIAWTSLRPHGDLTVAAMGTDAWNAAKLTEMHPDVRERFRGFLVAAGQVARRHRAELMIWEARRDLARQLRALASGASRTITSRHLWGCAIDVVMRDPRGPSWQHPPWYRSAVLPLAADHGLQSMLLAHGWDAPHVQSSMPDDAATLARELRREWEAGKGR